MEDFYLDEKTIVEMNSEYQNLTGRLDKTPCYLIPFFKKINDLKSKIFSCLDAFSKTLFGIKHAVDIGFFYKILQFDESSVLDKDDAKKLVNSSVIELIYMTIDYSKKILQIYSDLYMYNTPYYTKAILNVLSIIAILNNYLLELQ